MVLFIEREKIIFAISKELLHHESVVVSAAYTFFVTMSLLIKNFLGIRLQQ
jgi:hypothetical protein